MTRRGVPPLRFEVRAADLPLVPRDPDSPWLLAPPDVARALRRMQAAGPPLGSNAALRVHRGVITGANAVLLVREAKPRLGDLASIRAEGRSEEHTSELQSRENLVCRLLLAHKNK